MESTTMTENIFRGQQEPGEPDWIDGWLARVDPVEPPPGLVRDVMAAIAQPQPIDGRQRPERFRRETVMAKKVVWGAAAAAVVLIGIMLITGFPPAGYGVEGTIGAANRYQAQQISDKDVKLQDSELQALLQSDAWTRITRDKAAWSALTSKDVQRFFAAQAVQSALSNQAVLNALSIQAVQQALAAPGVASALSSAAVQQAFSSQAVQNILAAQGAQAAMASSAVQAALAATNAQNVLSAQAFMMALNNQAFAAALANPAFYAALANSSVQAALSNAAFLSALNSQAFVNALNNQAFAHALSSQTMLQQALNASQALAASQLR
jgi:hypothetical protein